MDVHFRFIARALIVDNGKILIARLKGAHSFFPGGGVDPGEGCETALRRELWEELGVKVCEVRRFLGVLETSFQDENVLHHEVSHWFEVSSKELSSLKNPQSLESHLEFYWIDNTLDSLQENKVLPEVVIGYIPSMLEGDTSIRISTLK
jgi:8-oxo-dGTP diphosphatase